MKYGFVYLWMDTRKSAERNRRRMYYIGCHWGTEDDGYICSSNRMRNAYYARPQDFSRRILQQVEKRKDLFWCEACWLWYIEPNELGIKYYNVSRDPKHHWSATKESYLSLKKKMSQIKKEFYETEQGQQTKRKISDYNKVNGVLPPSRKGCIGWQKGLTKKDNPSLARPGNGGHNIPIPRTGCRWFNNGVKETLVKVCPDGYTQGRLKWAAFL